MTFSRASTGSFSETPDPRFIDQNDRSLQDILVMKNGGQSDFLKDLNIVEEYPNFYHVRTNQEVIDALSGMGEDIRPLYDLNVISFDSVSFDVRDGEPDFPDSMRDDMTDLYLVKVQGPMKEEWLDRLSQLGTVLDSVRYFTYIVRVKIGMGDKLSSMDFVKWVGKYHPFYKVRDGFDGQEGPIRATLVFFKDDPKAFEKGLETVRSLGGVLDLTDQNTHWWNAARVEVPSWSLETLAKLDGLNFIEPYGVPTSRLDRLRWTIQSYDPVNKSTPIWDHGINGTGIILGAADTGIDYSHKAFRNSTFDVGIPGPDHRKIVQYNKSIDDWDDTSGHGSHTMGVLIGNNVSGTNGYYKFDGIAYGAKLAFYDVVLPSGTYDPPIMSDILKDAYNHGARSHSDSWGDDTTAYTSRAQRIDQFQWDHEEFMTFIAPGNGGIVWEPATAKNCISVGNAYNGENQDIASSSAVGPANGNMINPHLLAPGMNIMSPRADQNRTNSNQGYTSLSGTSLSTPAAAGAGGLVEQYFKDGFYPSGTKNPSDGFAPSGSLKKAALINSGWDQYGGNKGSSGVGHAPNNKQGWGKIKLDDVLYFDGDDRNLWVYDGYNSSNGQGLKTGEKDTYIIHANASEPFEVTLVWTDYPGQGLRNDLDLTVLDPSGNLYRGNVYSNGVSVTGGSADGANPTETFLLSDPTEGFYIINVSAINIQSQVYQRYSLVVSGSLQDTHFGDVNFDRDLYGVNENVRVRVVDSDLANNGVVQVKLSSLTETTVETLMLTESSVKGVFQGSMALSLDDVSNDGKLQVRDGDTIAVQYNEISPVGIRVDTAKVDASPPLISNVTVSQITDSTALVTWDTDEGATSNLSYGKSKALGQQKLDDLFITHHSIQLESLLSSTLYYFDVSCIDGSENQAVDDNEGSHYSFRTASYIISARPGYSGWVRQGEDYNHFSDGIMYSGQFFNLTRNGAMLFNLTTIPDNADMVAASVRVYGRGGFGEFMDRGSWNIEMLDSSVNDRFDGTTESPTYSNISNALVEATFDPRSGSSFGDQQWSTYLMPEKYLAHLEERLADDSVAFRLMGPGSGNDDMYSWDTGNIENGNSLGMEFAPQLVLTLNLIPIVSANAPDEIQIQEDGIYRLDLGTVFSDDGPLRYGITDLPSNLEANITNASLQLKPFPNWNGDDSITIRATDNDDLFSEHKIDISVSPVNDDPVLTSINGIDPYDGMVLNATEDKAFELTVTAMDVDMDNEGDLLFIGTNVSWLTFNGTNASFIPTNDDIGDRDITISAIDMNGAKDSVALTIHINNVNDFPIALILSPIEGTEATINDIINFNGGPSFDPDLVHGDNLTYIWYSSIEGKIGEGEMFEKKLEPGLHRITLTVRDKEGATAQNTVNITVWGDLDSDGILDPYDTDDDGDGLPDYWEDTYGLDPRNATDAKEDMDNDGYTNLKEYRSNTDPGDPKDRPTSNGDGSNWQIWLALVVLLIVLCTIVSFKYLTKRSQGTITYNDGSDDGYADMEEE